MQRPGEHPFLKRLIPTIADQRAAGCVIGVDYPKPIVQHEVASKANMERLNKAYAAHKAGGGDAKPPPKAAGGKRKLEQTTLGGGA